MRRWAVVGPGGTFRRGNARSVPVAYWRVFSRTATLRLLIPRPRMPRESKSPVDGSGTGIICDSTTNNQPNVEFGTLASVFCTSDVPPKSIER